MQSQPALTLPPLVSAFQAKLSRSLFKSLGEAISDLSRDYGAAYLDDFEGSLELLRSAFPEKPWPDWAVQGYVKLNKEILKEEMHFRKTGEYAAKPDDLERVAEAVYNNEDVMDGYYLVGLYCTYFLWPHHDRILDFYRRSFLQAGPPPRSVTEWGVGHGLLTLEALRQWPEAQSTVMDLSRYSLDFARRILGAAGVGGRCESRLGDVLTLPDLPTADRIICSELLEHVSNPDLLLDRLRGALAPGGLAYLTGAINAAQPDHVYLFTSDRQLFQLLENHGFALKASLTACHPSREGNENPPAVVAMVVEATA